MEIRIQREWVKDLAALHPCREALHFVDKYSSAQEAWDACSQPRWLLWLLDEIFWRRELLKQTKIRFQVLHLLLSFLLHGLHKEDFSESKYKELIKTLKLFISYIENPRNREELAPQIKALCKKAPRGKKYQAANFAVYVSALCIFPTEEKRTDVRETISYWPTAVLRSLCREGSLHHKITVRWRSWETLRLHLSPHDFCRIIRSSFPIQPLDRHRPQLQIIRDYDLDNL